MMNVIISNPCTWEGSGSDEVGDDFDNVILSADFKVDDGGGDGGCEGVGDLCSGFGRAIAGGGGGGDDVDDSVDEDIVAFDSIDVDDGGSGSDSGGAGVEDILRGSGG